MKCKKEGLECILDRTLALDTYRSASNASKDGVMEELKPVRQHFLGLRYRIDDWIRDGRSFNTIVPITVEFTLGLGVSIGVRVRVGARQIKKTFIVGIGIWINCVRERIEACFSNKVRKGVRIYTIRIRIGIKIRIKIALRVGVGQVKETVLLVHRAFLYRFGGRNNSGGYIILLGNRCRSRRIHRIREKIKINRTSFLGRRSRSRNRSSKSTSTIFLSFL